MHMRTYMASHIDQYRQKTENNDLSASIQIHITPRNTDTTDGLILFLLSSWPGLKLLQEYAHIRTHTTWVSPVIGLRWPTQQLALKSPGLPSCCQLDVRTVMVHCFTSLAGVQTYPPTHQLLQLAVHNSSHMFLQSRAHTHPEYC